MALIYLYNKHVILYLQVFDTSFVQKKKKYLIQLFFSTRYTPLDYILIFIFSPEQEKYVNNVLYKFFFFSFDKCLFFKFYRPNHQIQSNLIYMNYLQ